MSRVFKSIQSMTLKLSSSQILSCIVGFFLILLLSILVYSLRLINSKNDAYKLSLIMESPYESYAEITDKYALGGGFEIQYQFRGIHYGKVMKVRNTLYKQYKTGDKIPITLSRNNPSLVRITSELEAYKKPNL